MAALRVARGVLILGGPECGRAGRGVCVGAGGCGRGGGRDPVLVDVFVFGGRGVAGKIFRTPRVPGGPIGAGDVRTGGGNRQGVY